LEFIRVNRPASDTTVEAPLPNRGFHPSVSCSRYQPLTRSALVVSHHLDGFGSLQLLGLLHPRARQDSLRFRPVWPASVDDGPSRIFPDSAFTPFEDFPSLAAVPHHCGRCLLGVRQVIAPFRPHGLPGSRQLWPNLRLASPKTHTRTLDGRCSPHCWGSPNHGPSTVWTMLLPASSSPIARCTHSASNHLRVSSPMTLELPSLAPFACGSFRLFHASRDWMVSPHNPRVGLKKGAALARCCRGCPLKRRDSSADHGGYRLPQATDC